LVALYNLIDPFETYNRKCFTEYSSVEVVFDFYALVYIHVYLSYIIIHVASFYTARFNQTLLSIFS